LSALKVPLKLDFGGVLIRFSHAQDREADPEIGPETEALGADDPSETLADGGEEEGIL
jgi:hypothetical protein